MMNESPSLGHGIESTPAHLEYVSEPQSFQNIKALLMGMVVMSDKSNQITNLGLEGFDDILPEPLGAGEYENTFLTILQLAFVLSISPVAAQLTQTNLSERPKDVIQKWRDQKVLRGLRIIDLGSGRIPSFAIVAHALGAQSYTVDAEGIDSIAKEKIDGHIVTDLSMKGAVAILKKATGGNFDLVTEHIIGPIPEAKVHMYAPYPNEIIDMAKELLKTGGYLYSDQVESYQLRVNRPRMPLQRTR
ncbi:MAG: hypothetical protein AAB899_01485 [Patescibacteria group bacterium]